ncbi:MAG TPA: hypothetical protein DDY70_00295 [Clostridiales bacterium]|nr:hypothetical protein [Clostridiales bacterium]
MFFKTSGNGVLTELAFAGLSVPVYAEEATPLYAETDGCRSIVSLRSVGENAFVGAYRGMKVSLAYRAVGERLDIEISIENKTDRPFSPDIFALKLFPDTYMASYPAWNRQFFPTFLRCEATHFYGYFMTPEGRMLGMGCSEAIPAYKYNFNYHTEGYGHRIYQAELHLLHGGALPARYPKIAAIAPGEVLSRTISFFPVESLDTFEKEVSDKLGIPVLRAERYTVAPGEELSVDVFGKDVCVSVLSPDGAVTEGKHIGACARGEYLFRAKDTAGHVAELRALCRRSWEETLDMARTAAYMAPQKATTHIESYYGFFSAFLAAKYRKNPTLDAEMREHAKEILPLMFDFTAGRPKVIPKRVQNLAGVLSILADLYEADPDENAFALTWGLPLADYLVSIQAEDGSYRSLGTHYTCVIYIAKSLLEFSEAERAAGYTADAERHYESVRRAIDDLVLHLEKIGTEGEHTLEDGMISCSALQIGAFALTLPKEERAPYIRAAEHMLNAHTCLEGRKVPDYRMNSCTLRFWEAQYDVMVMANFMNSPHGWTAWTAYATYYLYLLTGKRNYLVRTVNTLGACTSLMHDDGTLSWAFCADPTIRAEVLVPDTTRPIVDAYRHVPKTPAYRGKFEVQTFGECYIPMISYWYRTGKDAPVTGGYATCPLFTDKETIVTDIQGGAGDNDVHEIFKCMEETVLGKVFLLEREDGGIEAFGAQVEEKDGVFVVTLPEETRELHINFTSEHTIIIGGEAKTYPAMCDFVKV